MSENRSESRLDIPALIEHHTQDCSRLLHGSCSTRSCLLRGGYKGSGGFNPSIATCEAYETVQALQSLVSDWKYHAERQALALP